ncbi:MAG TPA: hypothetical protein DCW53_02935 [Rikenellaceae bacterium]|nr:hypothetical protein [Rikenellaceae bacterium]
MRIAFKKIVIIADDKGTCGVRKGVKFKYADKVWRETSFFDWLNGIKGCDDDSCANRCGDA